MQLLVLLSMVTLCVVWNVVGIKILLVARRTRGFAELSLGLALFLMAGIGVPLSATVRLLASAETAPILTVVATVPTTLGIIFMYVFTAHVFYPGRRWAQAVVGSVALCGLWYVIGYGVERMAVQTAGEALALQMRWALFPVLGALLAFAWAGSAAYAHLRRLRRRMAYGLADAVVVNRLMLWSLFGAIAVATTVIAAVLTYTGDPFLRESVQPLTTAFGGVAVSVVLLLAFVPPKAYLEGVRRRAAAVATA